MEFRNLCDLDEREFSLFSLFVKSRLENGLATDKKLYQQVAGEAMSFVESMKEGIISYCEDEENKKIMAKLTDKQRKRLAEVTPDDLCQGYIQDILEWDDDLIPSWCLQIPEFETLSKWLQNDIHDGYVRQATVPRWLYTFINDVDDTGFRYENGELFCREKWISCKISKDKIEEWVDEGLTAYESMPPEYKVMFEKVAYEDFDEKMQEKIKTAFITGNVAVYAPKREPRLDIRYYLDSHPHSTGDSGVLIPHELLEQWLVERKNYKTKKK